MSLQQEAYRYRPTLRSAIFESVSAIVHTAYGMELSEMSAHNLSKANERLAIGPLVVYTNHVFRSDVPLIGTLLLSLPNTKRVIGPAGMKHYDFHRDPIGATLLRSARMFGIHALPVVQSNDTHPYGDT